MIKVDLSWVAEKVKGTLKCAEDAIAAAEKLRVEQVSTDTRTIQPGCLFVALSGANFNAHEFIGQAAEKGAVAAIVSEDIDVPIPLIKVSDTKLALGDLAAAVKASVAPKTVGITGSCGKTTVKEMVASILANRGKVLATKGNFNNEIGVPLTLLDLEPEHEFAVVEMGANHLGEIAYTCSLAKPDVATIVNADAAHLEGFGSLFGVARAKSEIFSGVHEFGAAILNQDSQFYEYWQGKSRHLNCETFSRVPQANYYPSNVNLNFDGCPEFTLNTPIGSTFVSLPVPGFHNVTNAVLAAGLAINVGADLQSIKMGLENMPQVKGRLNIKSMTNQVRLLDDTYNANIASVNAAIDVLKSFPGRRVVILGDMGELGEKARYYHEQVGEYARKSGIDYFISLGVLSQHASDVFEAKGKHFSDIESLVSYTETLLGNEQCDISILVKGSRGARMENVVSALEGSSLGKLERMRERIAC